MAKAKSQTDTSDDVVDAVQNADNTAANEENTTDVVLSDEQKNAILGRRMNAIARQSTARQSRGISRLSSALKEKK